MVCLVCSCYACGRSKTAFARTSFFCCVGGRPTSNNAVINQKRGLSRWKVHWSLAKNTIETMMTFDCRLDRLFLVEIGVWCCVSSVVLCCWLFLLVESISAWPERTINFFLSSSAEKWCDRDEYIGWLLVRWTFGCQNRVAVPPMVLLFFSSLFLSCQRCAKSQPSCASASRITCVSCLKESHSNKVPRHPNWIMTQRGFSFHRRKTNRNTLLTRFAKTTIVN